MSLAVQIRCQVEDVLAKRVPSALSPPPRTLRPVTPIGIAELDAQLNGGVPQSAITELVGPESSGRTTIALSLLAGVTAAGQVCAWIDAADTLDPESVAANGVDLERLLWIRCSQAAKPSPTAQQQEPPTPVAVTARPRPSTGGSPHPRSEGKDMPEAVSALLQAHGGLYDRHVRRERKKIGTPGMPNRPLAQRSEHREEQVNSDRLPSRRGDNLTLVHQSVRPAVKPRPTSAVRNAVEKPRWAALDQALRATDLVLQSGGFSVIVLDLGSIAPEQVWRIPLATWFRYRAACESTRATLLLLTQHACAKSSAELVLRACKGTVTAEGAVLTGIRYATIPERHRFQKDDPKIVPIRKPPQPERSGAWSSKAAWA